jgi:hypothetical protein
MDVVRKGLEGVHFSYSMPYRAIEETHSRSLGNSRDIDNYLTPPDIAQPLERNRRQDISIHQIETAKAHLP